MLYVHEDNIKTKINKNYKGLKEKLEDFYDNVYLETKLKLLDIDFSSNDEESFKLATEIINEYYDKLTAFAAKYNVRSESKFASSFLEEISTYLFQDNELIQNGKLGLYNKGVYAGLKIGSDLQVNIVKKDVDFCIGKKTNITIDNNNYDIILPIVAVEVKTYLDGTMFGEVQFSSKLLKSATPKVKTYVLMGYNDVGKDKIISARYDKVLDEMFVLRMNEQELIEYTVLQDYYNQICSDIENIAIERGINTPGRLIDIEE